MKKILVVQLTVSGVNCLLSVRFSLTTDNSLFLNHCDPLSLSIRSKAGLKNSSITCQISTAICAKVGFNTNTRYTCVPITLGLNINTIDHCNYETSQVWSLRLIQQEFSKPCILRQQQPQRLSLQSIRRCRRCTGPENLISLLSGPEKFDQILLWDWTIWSDCYLGWKIWSQSWSLRHWHAINCRNYYDH